MDPGGSPHSGGSSSPCGRWPPCSGGRSLDGLRRAYDRSELRFAGSAADLAEPAAFTALLATLRAADWVVYAKPPFGGLAQVLEVPGAVHAPGRAPPPGW